MNNFKSIPHSGEAGPNDNKQKLSNSLAIKVHEISKWAHAMFQSNTEAQGSYILQCDLGTAAR